jgi:hypothetical protein
MKYKLGFLTSITTVVVILSCFAVNANYDQLMGPAERVAVSQVTRQMQINEGNCTRERSKQECLGEGTTNCYASDWSDWSAWRCPQ